MLFRIDISQQRKQKGRVVVLCHDRAFKPHEVTPSTDKAIELDTLLQEAINAGYRFKTIENYQIPNVKPHNIWKICVAVAMLGLLAILLCIYRWQRGAAW